MSATALSHIPSLPSTSILNTTTSGMVYQRLGNTGLKVSRIGLGCMTYGSATWQPWILDEEKSKPFIKRALELGINFFDTANIYSLGESEAILGRALKEFKVPRDDVVIATKVFFSLSGGKIPNGGGLSRKHIMASCDDSLARLQTSYIDLYQIHRWDKETPIEETMEALHDLVKSGKVRYIGASSMAVWQFAKANAIAKQRGWTPFVSMQNHYNGVYREEEREMNPYCVSEGIGLIPYSPLAKGFLTGNRRAGENVKFMAGYPGGTAKQQAIAVAAAEGKIPIPVTETLRGATDAVAHTSYYQPDDFIVVDRFREVAERLKVSTAQVALAWVLARPGVTSPIVGASKMPQLEEAVAALKVVLTKEDMTYLEEPYQPHRILGHTSS